MPVSVRTGRAWTRIAESIDDFAPVPDDHILLAGVRSMEQAERDLVEANGMRLVPPGQLADGETLEGALADLSERVEDVHVHMDLDVIDPSLSFR